MVVALACPSVGVPSQKCQAFCLMLDGCQMPDGSAFAVSAQECHVKRSLKDLWDWMAAGARALSLK